jgi:hypothetical protein
MTAAGMACCCSIHKPFTMRAVWRCSRTSIIQLHAHTSAESTASPWLPVCHLCVQHDRHCTATQQPTFTSPTLLAHRQLPEAQRAGQPVAKAAGACGAGLLQAPTEQHRAGRRAHRPLQVRRTGAHCGEVTWVQRVWAAMLNAPCGAVAAAAEMHAVYRPHIPPHVPQPGAPAQIASYTLREPCNQLLPAAVTLMSNPCACS